MVGPTALIDAAIFYGAERVLSGVHDDPEWPYRFEYNKESDERLFRELLHQIALYDTLYLDQSSLSEAIPNEVFSLCKRINGSHTIFDKSGIVSVFRASDNMDVSPNNVQRSFCQYVADRIESDDRLSARLKNIPIPWAYHQPNHHDRPSIQWQLKSVGLDECYLPFVLFAWRGLMYGAIAHSERKSGNVISSYVAAPGRVLGLREVLAADDMERFDFPNEAWRSLTYQLPMLPPRGYDFSFLKSLPAVDTSPIATLASEHEPKSALEHVLDWRTTRNGRDLREDWEELLDARLEGTIVGSTTIQIAKNINTAGDFNQIIVARARGMKVMTYDSDQSAKRINTSGKVEIISDVASTKQRAEDVNGSSFKQEIRHQKSGLQLGQYRAVGVTGVIALLIIALGWFVLSYFTR